MEYRFIIEGGNFAVAGEASGKIKNMLKQLNLPHELIKRTVICFYEAEINIVAHAWKGEALFSIEGNTIRMIFTDEGPGIPDIHKAMQEGYSTASDRVREMGFGAGMGLPNIRRNSDTFNLESTVGEGTRLTITNTIL